VDLANEEGSGAAPASASASVLYSLLADQPFTLHPSPFTLHPSPFTLYLNPNPNPNPNPNQVLYSLLPDKAALDPLGMSTIWELISAFYVLLSGLFLLRYTWHSPQNPRLTPTSETLTPLTV